jgi:hypothetical protein
MYDNGNAVKEIVQMAPITIQNERRGALIKEVHEAINQIEIRISAVTKTKAPVAATTDRPLRAVADEPTCDLHSMLIEHNDSLEHALRRIHDLRERVQL